MALRAEIDAVFAGTPETDLGKDLLKTVTAFNLPKKYFIELLEGVAKDLDPQVRYNTPGDLRWYMYRVACVVGLMCIEIFGYKNPRAKEYAVALGYAVQLTNIVRDAGEDAKINRIYIPRAEMESFGVSEQELLSLKDSAKTKALLYFMLERAQDYYNKARRLMPKEDFVSLLPARAMGNIYESILKKLQKGACRLSGNKVKLSKTEKVMILFRTWREKP